MLITPGSTAFLLTKKFGPMLAIAVLVSVTSSIIGAYSSYYFDISTGGAIVFTQGILFLLAFIYYTNRFKGSVREVVE
jgi:manganese transport system permease protein